VAELQQRTWETLSNRPSFYSFNHRGKIFPQGWVFYAFCISCWYWYLLHTYVFIVAKVLANFSSLIDWNRQPSVHQWWPQNMVLVMDEFSCAVTAPGYW